MQTNSGTINSAGLHLNFTMVTGMLESVEWGDAVGER